MPVLSIKGVPRVRPPSLIINVYSTLHGVIEDSLAMDIVKKTMNNSEFTKKLKQEFISLYCPNETELDNILINKFESTNKTANQDCHFIINLNSH